MIHSYGNFAFKALKVHCSYRRSVAEYKCRTALVPVLELQKPRALLDGNLTALPKVGKAALTNCGNKWPNDGGML